MISKVAVLFAVVAVAAARPDKPAASEEGYQYQQPAQTFSAGQYQPPQRSYEAPEESDEAPAQTYAAPSAPRATYAAPKSEESEEHEPLMPFDFGYIVEDDETESAYGHKSNSDGQQVTGQYRVLLPDGRTQIVTYTADRENGYRAEVTYEGEAREWVPPQSEESVEQPRASYSAP